MSIKTKLFAVTGNPVLHSKSPRLMNPVFEKLGYNAFYTRLRAESADEIIRSFDALQLNGINITAPYKQKLLTHVNNSDVAVKYIGALNTIIKEENAFLGYNTDFIGVINALKEKKHFLAGQRVLVIGAGGAARAAVFGLIEDHANVCIVNRTYEKAQKLAQVFNVKAAPISDIKNQTLESDIIINTVSGDISIIDASWLTPEHIVFDANYPNSRLIDSAYEVGCNIIPGYNWLLHQAIPAFYIFTNHNPYKEIMRDALTAPESSHYPDGITLFSDEEIPAKLIEPLQEALNIKVQNGHKANQAGNEYIAGNQAKNLKILLFSDNYTKNTPDTYPEEHYNLYHADLIIPIANKNQENVINILKDEINKAYKS